MPETLRVLFIGDIVGKPGRQTVRHLLAQIVQKFKIDLCIANAENAAAGFGLNEKTAQEIFAAGVQIITTGNHVWDKKEVIPLISKDNRILRPANYPLGVPGVGSITFKLPTGSKVAVINLLGRVFMNTLDCPFRAFDKLYDELSQATNIFIVDFHAETTSEKTAFGYYTDGRASAVIGTHTHVQTADERILPAGTAYITDVGMTGPKDSIIGVEKEQILSKFLHHMPLKYNVAQGPCALNAVVIDIDASSGKAKSIQRLQISD